VMDFVRYRYLL